MPEVRKAKEELKNEWEKCFNKKIEDKFSEKGLKKFWDDKTSVEEAEAMLTGAAIDDAINHLIISGLGAIIIGHIGHDGHKEEQANKTEKNESNSDFDYNVFDTVKQEFVSVGNETWEIADEEAKKYCLENGVKYADVKICKMYD